MITIYVQKATNLSGADLNGLSDPYVRLFGRTEYATFEFAKTETIKNTINPVWDFNCERPFFIEFVRAACLYFEVYDRDICSKDDPLGYTYFDWSQQKLGEVVGLTMTPNFNSKLFVKVMPLSDSIPISPWTPEHDHLYFYFTAVPPMTDDRFAKVTLLEYDTKKPNSDLVDVQTVCELASLSGQQLPFQIVGSVTLIEGRGTTNVIRILPDLVDPSKQYVPGVHAIVGYRGTIVIHFMQTGKEKNTGLSLDGRQIKEVDPKETSDVMHLSIAIKSDDPIILSSALLISQRGGIQTGNVVIKSHKFITNEQ